MSIGVSGEGSLETNGDARQLQKGRLLNILGKGGVARAQIPQEVARAQFPQSKYNYNNAWLNKLLHI